MIEYNQVVVGDIDITETYKRLMAASIGQGSVYLKAKETLNDSLDSMKGLSESDKAKVLGDTISAIAKTITSEAMQVALKIELENRDAPYALTKVKEDTRLVTAQIAKTEKEIDLADENVWIATVTGWKAQAEVYRDYGIQTWNQAETSRILPQAAYLDYGTKVSAMKKADVDTYATYANSYRQNGLVTYTANSDGSLASASGDGVYNGLTYFQMKVAERQIQGFDDNMRQHVVNSSASMISMLVSSEVAGIDYTPFVNRWNSGADYLLETP